MNIPRFRSPSAGEASASWPITEAGRFEAVRVVERYAAALAFLLPLAIYISTMAPTVWWLDSAELTTGAYSLGIVHAPGAPLYLSLGHLFSQLPVGDIGYRLNLMTACASGLTALFVYLVVHHLTRERLLALATAWFTAFGFYVWFAAVAAELYAVQGCFVAGLLLLALKWREQQHPWQLCALAFFFGLGTGNHMSLVLMLPGYALLALATPLPWRRPRWLVAATVCGLLGGLIWLYIPLRYAADPALNYANAWDVELNTWAGFWWMVTGQMFESMFFAIPLADMPMRIGEYLFQLWSNFLGIGALLGVYGLVRDSQERPILNSALLAMFVGHLVFYLPYAAIDQEQMMLPTYIIWGIWCGLGAYYLQRRFAGSLPHRACTMVVACLALAMLGVNYSYANLSGNYSAHERGERLFEAFAEDAVFYGTWIDTPILEYLQIVESRRNDVQLMNVLFMSPQQELDDVKQALANGRPVYTTVDNFLSEKGFEAKQAADCECQQLFYNEAASVDKPSSNVKETSP